MLAKPELYTNSDMKGVCDIKKLKELLNITFAFRDFRCHIRTCLSFNSKKTG